MSCSEIAKAENEVGSRLTAKLTKRLTATLPAGKQLSKEFTIELLGTYLCFARHGGQDPDHAIRAYLSDTKLAIRNMRKKSEALQRSLRAFMIEPPSMLAGANFNREFEFPDLYELRDMLDHLESNCECAVAFIKKKGLRPGRRIDRVRWAFLKQTLRIWVLSVGSPPPITLSGPSRQNAAARKKGSFSDFLFLIEELVPDDCKPNPISEDFLKEGLASLRTEMIAFLNSGGQIAMQFPQLDP